MKKLLIILFAITLLIACERKSGRILPPEDTKYKVEIIGLSEAVIDSTTGLKLYKHKVRKYDEHSPVKGESSYVLLNNVFDYGDIIIVRKSQLLNP